MWYGNFATFLTESVEGGQMTIETALERMAQFGKEYGESTSSVGTWTVQVSKMRWSDGCLIRKLQAYGLAHLACVDALKQLQERYPAEVKKFFDPLLAELTLRENRAVLRGENNIEI